MATIPALHVVTVTNLITAGPGHAAGAARPAPMLRHPCLQKAPRHTTSLSLSLSCALPPSLCLCQPSARRSHRLRRHHRPSSHRRYCSRCCAQCRTELSTPPPPPCFPRRPACARLARSHRLCHCHRAAARLGHRTRGRATVDCAWLRCHYRHLPPLASPSSRPFSGLARRYKRPQPGRTGTRHRRPWPVCHGPSQATPQAPMGAGGHTGARATLLRHRRPPTGHPRDPWPPPLLYL
jgi:hypothetical protein